MTAVTTSFIKWNGVQAPRLIGLANYLRLAASDNSQAAAFIHVPFGVLVALVLFKRPRGWRFTRAVFMIPNVLGWTALSILSMFIYLPDAGILNGLIQLLGFPDFNRNWLYDPGSAFATVTLIWLFFAAVITLITMSELMAIPESLVDSARIDGASPLQIDLYINLPIVGTGIVIAMTAVLKAEGVRDRLPHHRRRSRQPHPEHLGATAPIPPLTHTPCFLTRWGPSVSIPQENNSTANSHPG